MAVGFEKMEKGSLKIGAEDREQPLMKHMMALGELYEFVMPPAPYMFGAAGREHMEKYGSTPEHFAKIGEKNHRHSANNPYAQFQDVYTLQEILDAKMVYPPLTRLQCSPTSDGSGAAVLASEEFVEANGLASQAIEIVGQTIVTDLASTFTAGTAAALAGYDMTKEAGRQVFEQAGLGIDDFQVIELHDCFSTNETAHLRGARPGRRGRRPQADRQRRHHLRRPLDGQPLRRADLQRPPAGRHRPGPVLRAGLAAARHRGCLPGRRRFRRPATQHRPGRRRRRHRLPARRPLTRSHTMPTIDSTLRSTVRRIPDAEALKFGDIDLTYAQLDEAVDRAARALAGLGLNKGDRVALMSTMR